MKFLKFSTLLLYTIVLSSFENSQYIRAGSIKACTPPGVIFRMGATHNICGELIGSLFLLAFPGMRSIW